MPHMLRRPGFARNVANTTGFNIAATTVAAVAGLVIARGLGPTGRGEYAAIVAWYAVTLLVGEVGQTAATCFFVAKEPGRARDYVATSRTMMVLTGIVVLGAGLILAPWLANGQAGLTWGYRVMFATSIAAFVGASYIFALQATDIRRWNVARVSQPILFLAVIVVLHLLGILSLRTTLIALSATIVIQAAVGYQACRRVGLAGGRTRRHLFPPLLAYGASQMAAIAPATLNGTLDKLVLSQTAPAADLGRYAVAVSLTSLGVPLVAAIGNMAFPRLASREMPGRAAVRLQRVALAAAAGIAILVVAPIALLAHWLVPALFGAGFAGTDQLVWLLAPGGVFLACGQVVGDLLRGRNRPLVVARGQAIAAVFTIALLAVLLPRIGVAGAAIASTISYGIALLYMVWKLNSLAPDAVDDAVNWT